MGGFALRMCCYPLHFHFPSTSLPYSDSNSLVFYLRNKSNPTTLKKAMRWKKKKRVALAACHGQGEPNDAYLSRRRAIFLVDISILSFLQLGDDVLDGLAATISEERAMKTLQKSRNELAIETSTSQNPILSLLNGIGIFGTVILGALYALAQKEKEATQEAIESMTDKLKEKEAAMVSLEQSFESKLLSEQGERSRLSEKAMKEQQILLNQLSSVNSTITGLGKELNSEKSTVEKLKEKLDSLEVELSKSREEKKSLQEQLREKNATVEALQDKIVLIGTELKGTEDSIQRLSCSLAEKEVVSNNQKTSYVQIQGELAKAHNSIESLSDELLKSEEVVESKNSLMDQLNSTLASLMAERDDVFKKVQTLQDDYSNLKSSSDNKAAHHASQLKENEDELHLVKGKLQLALTGLDEKQTKIASLLQETEDSRKMLDVEVNNVKNLRDELYITREALGETRNEASGLKNQLKEVGSRYSDLEVELVNLQSEYAAATETYLKILEMEKQSGEALSNELTLVREQLQEATEGFGNVSRELKAVTEDRNNIQKELVIAYKDAEDLMNDLREEKSVVLSLNKELQNLEKQIMEEKETRKALEVDLEETTRSLDEMNRNVLMLSGELEKASSLISNLEHEKDVLYKSLVEQKNASKEAVENLEDAHNFVLRLGKERERLEKKANKLEDELAAVKGEILRLRRSQMNSLNAKANDQQKQQGEADANECSTEINAPITTKRTTRRRKSNPQ